MEINNKKDFTSSLILTGTWAVLATIFFIVGPMFIGAMFACSTVISGYYVLTYYLSARKEQISKETYETLEVVETTDIDN